MPDESIWPQFFLSSWESRLAWPLQQHNENLKRLPAQTDLQSILAQFSGSKVNFEDSKANDSGILNPIFHSANVPGEVVL